VRRRLLYAYQNEPWNECDVLATALASFASTTQSAIASKTWKPTSQLTSLRQHRRRSTSMLNIIRTEAEPDFLSFVAHPLANMFPMIEGNAFEELKRDISAQGILEPSAVLQRTARLNPKPLERTRDDGEART
jgi:hypothetical protein